MERYSIVTSTLILSVFISYHALAQSKGVDTVNKRIKNVTETALLKQHQAIQHQKITADSSSQRFIIRRDSLRTVLKGLKNIKYQLIRNDTIKAKGN
ncbi:MAG: hypothetical protein JSS93_01035 [Bacteroidetes bacterium]|nr:hypothetical protein [Bacteroidota bacterium]MBS1558339.1 hypothetical protein [Bacteroidota bacterium]MBS1981359.1 hypothetical protein [Bacteroidota bacterium]